MSEKETIHSTKPLTEHLSNLNFLLGMISIIIFVVSLFFENAPIQGNSNSPFFIDRILVSTICMVGTIISSITITTISIMEQKNFMRYHFRAIIGFFLALLPIILTALAGK
jgi:hypothetical protein